MMFKRARLFCLGLLLLATPALAANTVTGLDVSTSQEVIPRAHKRISTCIQNTGTADAYCSMNCPATSTNSFVVAAYGGAWCRDNHESPDEPVCCYAPIATHLVVGEWFAPW